MAASCLRRQAAEIARIVRAVARSGADSVAVCLLFSFVNPAHEKLLARALATTGLPVSISHEILPEYREFERTSTTVVNAYLVPVMSGYLSEIERIAEARSWSSTCQFETRAEPRGEFHEFASCSRTEAFSRPEQPPESPFERFCPAPREACLARNMSPKPPDSTASLPSTWEALPQT